MKFNFVLGQGGGGAFFFGQQGKKSPPTPKTFWSATGEYFWGNIGKQHLNVLTNFCLAEKTKEFLYFAKTKIFGEKTSFFLKLCAQCFRLASEDN
jgi:hypothetical protein